MHDLDIFSAQMTTSPKVQRFCGSHRQLQYKFTACAPCFYFLKNRIAGHPKRSDTYIFAFLLLQENIPDHRCLSLVEKQPT
jgi:hypothetical protein